jgi:hypothetical protein
MADQQQQEAEHQVLVEVIQASANLSEKIKELREILPNRAPDPIQAGLSRLSDVPDDATDVIVHALETFGSVRKAAGWLNDACGALDGEKPLELILSGQKDRVEAELDLIRDGAYV